MASIFSKTVGGPIDSATAKKWMKNYKDKNPDPKAVIARFIGTDTLNSILQEKGCVGLRVYFGLNDEGQMEIFFVGTREDGTNMWPDEMSGKDGSGGSGKMVNSTIPCPPYCG